MIRRPYLIVLLSIFFLFITGCKSEEPPKVEKQKINATAQQKPNTQTNSQSNEQVTGEGKVKAKEETMEYRNEEYGFTLKLPKSWEGKYVVERTDTELGEEEATYIFKYKEENIELFSIVVLNISKEKWDKEFSGGFWEYLGEKDGKIFAYGVSTELPHQLSENRKEKIHSLIDVTKMVNQDIPRIVKTFQLLY